MHYESKKYVELCDYDNLTVDNDYIEISDEDVTDIINMDLSCSDSYILLENRITAKEGDTVLITVQNEQQYYLVGSEDYSKNFDERIQSLKIGETENIQITDDIRLNVTLNGIYRSATSDDEKFVLDYYGYNTFDEVDNFIRTRAKNEIMYNYAIDYITTNSIIYEYPEEINKQIEKEIEKTENTILKDYSSLEDYYEEYQISYEDIKNNIMSNYSQLMIYKAILDNENTYIDESDMNKYIDENECENLRKYEIYSYVAEEKLREILPNKIIVK